MKTYFVLLTEGGSSRTGSFKQLLPYGKSTLPAYAISNAVNSRDERIITSRHASKDGVPVLFPKSSFNAPFEQAGDQGVGFMLNLTTMNTITVDKKRSFSISIPQRIMKSY